MLVKKLAHLFRQDYSVGLLLILATIAAMFAANSSFAPFYSSLLEVPIKISIGSLQLNETLLHWINDGLMAIFFLLVGLEIKQEVMEGELRTLGQASLPAFAAIGGVIFPVLFYIAFNYGDSSAMRGWAIPAATDIAFAVGVLALLGNRVPPSLKIFLLALAIIDDLGAIAIISIFYSKNIALTPIIISIALFTFLILLNKKNVTLLSPYLVTGFLLWICLLKSGLHTTLAGVMIAFTIPMNPKNKKGRSPLCILEYNLHTKVNYFILPLFAFANAGVSLHLETLTNDLFSPVSMGVFTGLFLGKQLGIFIFSFLTVKLGISKLPNGANWLQMYGVSLLCGIGFTMSLFISSLAFTEMNSIHVASSRLSIILSSLISAITGMLLLYFSHKYKKQNPPWITSI